MSLLWNMTLCCISQVRFVAAGPFYSIAITAEVG